MAGAYALGRPAFFVLICVVVLAALFEMFDAVVRAGSRAVLPFGLLAGLALLIAAYLERPALIGVILVATMTGAFVLALRPGRGSKPASDVAWTVLGVAWIGGGGAAAVGIMMLPSGLALLVGFVITAALDDVAAYFVGTRFGRHKMAPSISAAKSWEGVVAGAVAALVGGAVVGALIDPLGPVPGVGLGALVAVLAPVGDLAESLFKREVGIKDSGRLLPGHGGALDRLDAILFSLPAVFVYLHLLVL